MRLGAAVLVIVCSGLTWAQRPAPRADSLPYTPPKRRAICIGASKYDSLGRLAYSVRDCREFAKVLTDDFRFKPDSVTTLTDDEGGVPPTASNIRKALDSALADPELDRSDLFIFYFAGHGLGTPSGDYLAPTDATVENVQQIGVPVKEVVEKFVARGLRSVLVITDACRAGEKNTFGAELSALSEKTNIAVLLGCQPGTRSYQYSRYGHGAFTYSLMKAMKDTSLRDPASGALWVSKVGESTRKAVEELTEPDYGEEKQVPAVLADDRRDVLLGAYPPANLTDEALAKFKSEVERLGPEHRAASLIEFADRLSDLNDYLSASEMMKVADALSPLDLPNRYMLFNFLSLAGRDAESVDQMKKIIATKDPLYSNLAIASDSMSERDPAERVKAALALIKFGQFEIRYLATEVVRQTGTAKQHAECCRAALAGLELKKREQTYFEAQLAWANRDYVQAETLFTRALKEPGAHVGDRMLLLDLFLVATDAGHVEKVPAICDLGVATGQYKGFWLVVKGQSLKAMGRKDESFEAVKQAIEQDDLDDGALLLVMNVAGLRSFELADKIQERAAKMPRAWKAQLAAAIAKGLKNSGPGAVYEAFIQASSYASDERQLLLSLEQTLEPLLTDAYEAKAITPEMFRDILVARSGMLCSSVGTFREVEELWWHLVEDGLRCYRAPQLMRIFDTHLGARQKANTLSSNLRSLYLVVAVNSANWGKVDEVYAQGGFSAADQSGADWTRAVSLVCRGDNAAAVKFLAGLKPPTKDYAQTAAGLKLYLQAATAPDKVIPALKAAKLTEPVARAFVGMAWLKAGKMEQAEEFLAESLSQQSWVFQSVHQMAVQALHDEYRRRGLNDEADLVTWINEFSFAGYAMTRPLSYGVNAKFESTTFACRVIDDNTQAHEEILTITVAQDKSVKGTLGKIAFAGRLDANGNLIPSPGEWQIMGKLPPIGLAKRLPQYAENGAVFVLLNSKGERLVVSAKPKSS